MPPNRSPIYTGTIFRWDASLTTVTAPRVIAAETPTLLGSAGSYGALIYHIRCLDLGDDVGTVIRFYTRRTIGLDLNYRLLFELEVAQATGSSEATANTVTEADLPVLPLFGGAVKGLHIDPNTEVYCALGTSVTQGKQIHVTGGLYELAV